MDRDTIETLRACPMFAGITGDPLQAMAYLLKRVELGAGARLFSEGDAGADAYIVMSGTIQILTPIGDGTEQVRAELGRGALFGELALFGDGSRTASAVAKDAAVLGGLGYTPFLELIRTWPEIALALLRIQTDRFRALERDYRALTQRATPSAAP